MPNRTIAAALALTLEARDRCSQAGNTAWEERHAQAIQAILDTFPTGSGFDAGPPSAEMAEDGTLILGVEFHAMNEHGYVGWITFQVTARPSWLGIDLDVHPILDSHEYHAFQQDGVDVEDLADYVGEVFYDWLTSPAPNREAA